jgi:hypothetical protein
VFARIENLRKGQRIIREERVETVIRDAVATGTGIFVDTDRGQFRGVYDDTVELFDTRNV